MLATLIAQQMIVASSVYWLAQAARLLGQDVSYKNYLILYGASLLMPFFIGYFSITFLERWTLAAIDSFCKSFFQSYEDKIDFFEEGPASDNARSVLSKESSSLTNKFTNYIYGLLASFLNLSLSLFVVAYVIDMKLIGIFGASLSATYLLIQVNRKNYAKYAELQQSAANDLSSSLLRGWDSLVIGNKINKLIFYNSLSDAQKKFEKSTIMACLFDQRQSIGIAVISAIPTILYVIFQIIQSQDKAVAAAALASLPRIFQIISSSHTVLTGFSQWHGYKAKLNFIESKMPGEDYSSCQKSRVSIAKINIENADRKIPVSSIEDAFTKFQKSGRYTITGPNGVGKSSILKLLKMHLKDEAFYLPAKHQLLFQADIMQGSSGEITRRQIEEALTDQSIKVLLLDEWDANLDTVNTKMLDEKIQSLTSNKIVIEVRHKSRYQEV